jgi:membrane protease YdiL (CAAX protease family)
MRLERHNRHYNEPQEETWERIPKRLSGILGLFHCTVFINTVASFSKYLLPPAAEVLPDWTFEYIGRSVTVPITKVAGVFSFVFPSLIFNPKSGNQTPIDFTDLFFAAMAEELVCRQFLQSFCLRSLPKQILNKAAPDCQDLVDCKIAKITRVLIASAIFALAHGRHKTCGGFLLPSFATGLLYGYWKEKESSWIDLTLSHFLYNSLVIADQGGVDFSKSLCI